VNSFELILFMCRCIGVFFCEQKSVNVDCFRWKVMNRKLFVMDDDISKSKTLVNKLHRSILYQTL
jgi:hypothetical protein